MKAKVLLFFKKAWKEIKTHRYLQVICVLVILLSPFIIVPSFSRYIFEKINDNYLLSKKFYFYSNSLNGGEAYILDDWDGETNYTFYIDVNNYIDELRWTNMDINYMLNITCDPSISGNVTCSPAAGVVDTIEYNPSTGTSKRIGITIANTNGLSFNQDDYVTVDIEARSTSPYRKSLRDSFRVIVNPKTINYTIEDAVNRVQAVMILSNNKSIAQTVTLSWDYDVLSIDNTIDTVINAQNRSTYVVNGVTYINGLTIEMPAKSSKGIVFYKTDKTQNYTYPIVNDASVVEVS